MRSRTLTIGQLCGSAVLAVLLSQPARALPINEISDLLAVNVCFVSGTLTECGGPDVAALKSSPDAMHWFFLGAPDGTAFVGLSDRHGDLQAGNDHLRLELHVNPGGALWLDGVQLVTGQQSPSEFWPGTEITWSSVSLYSGQTAADLNRAVGHPNGDPVGIVSGVVVIAFDVIPEPTTALLVGLGLVGLGVVRQQRDRWLRG